jgi:hypothetical protein
MPAVSGWPLARVSTCAAFGPAASLTRKGGMLPSAASSFLSLAYTRSASGMEASLRRASLTSASFCGAIICSGRASRAALR